MTATYAYDGEPRSGHPLLPGASPYDIRANLLPEDHGKFDAEYLNALAEARQSLDLTELFKTLEHWRRVALLQSNPEDYRQMMAQAEHTLRTGERPPGSVPWSKLKAELGLQGWHTRSRSIP